MHPADLSPAEQPCGTSSLILADRRIATAVASGYGFAMGELSGQLLFANAATLRIVEEESEEAFTNKTFYQYYVPEDAERLKQEKLTNMRASGSDRNILLKPARRLSLEEALEFIEADELVEITPTQVRLRKIILRETDRRRAARAKVKNVRGCEGRCNCNTVQLPASHSPGTFTRGIGTTRSA
ncbi:MAG: hypothetical protein HQ567_04220 [Candidatus Nealsonbacteria bacterium]|nr:hypothetical protein [Candidatus Nealsonbacteria bacterium]